MSGFVYVAKYRNAESPVKIGMTKDPMGRTKSLNSTSHHDHIDMIKKWPVADPRYLESQIHRDPALKTYRTQGKEWFTVTADQAIQICEKYCVQFNNDRFDRFSRGFRKANTDLKEQFYHRLFNRVAVVHHLLTEWELANPGQQSTQRSPAGRDAPAGVFVDAVRFWLEWQSLSQTFDQFMQRRLIDSHYLHRHYPDNGYRDSEQPEKQWSVGQPFQSLTECDRALQAIENYRMNWQRYLEGQPYRTSSVRNQLRQRRFKLSDLYAIRMEPLTKFEEFALATESEQFDRVWQETDADIIRLQSRISVLQQQNRAAEQERQAQEQRAEQHRQAELQKHRIQTEREERRAKQFTEIQCRLADEEWKQQISLFFAVGIWLITLFVNRDPTTLGVATLILIVALAVILIYFRATIERIRQQLSRCTLVMGQNNTLGEW